MTESLDYDEILPRVLARLFPEPSLREAAERRLSPYGAIDDHREVSRVRVAILQVAGSDLEALEKQTELACTDYRDALVAAEFPEQFRHGHLADRETERHRELVEEDRRRHLAWIEEMTSG